MDDKNFQRLMYSFGQLIFSLAFLLLLIQIQGLETQVVEQKKDIIFFINRAKGVDVMLMAFYLTVGYLSSFAINTILAVLFKRGSEAPSIKEPNFWDQMFSFDSFYDAVMHLFVPDVLFQLILWTFIMVTLCTLTLSLYGIWSSLSARTRMNIKRVPFTLSASMVFWFALLFGFPHDLVSYCADSDTLVPDDTEPPSPNAQRAGGVPDPHSSALPPQHRWYDNELTGIRPDAQVNGVNTDSDGAVAAPDTGTEVQSAPEAPFNFNFLFVSLLAAGGLYLASPELLGACASLKDAAVNVSTYSLKLLQQVWDCTMGRSMADGSREMGGAHRKGMVESTKIAVGGALTCISLHHMWQIARFAIRMRYRR